MPRSPRYKSIQLPQLRGFRLVATKGSFTAAAEALGVSVPTVWEQVRALERKLGATLLQQRGRVLQLTPEGRLLLELAQEPVSALDSLPRLFEMRRPESPQQFVVASTTYLLTYHLPRPVRDLSAAYPATRVSLRAVLTLEVPPLVERRQADVGIVPHMRDEPRNPDLDYECLFDLEFTLLTSVRHPLARKKWIRAEDLVEYPLILAPPESHAHKTLKQILQKHNLEERAHFVLESYSVDMARHFAALGVGVALCYVDRRAPLAMPGLYMRPFDPRLEGLPVALVVPKYAHLSEPVQEFRRILRRALAPSFASRSD